MITSRGMVEGDPKTLSMLQFDPGERIRSVQLYGVDPMIMARATEILITEYGVDHVDLNFGCPVPKVTRKGGGAALPYKRDRLRMILRATVAAAGPLRRAGDDQDPDRHRRRSSDVSWTPAGSPSRPDARRSRCTAARRNRPTPATRTGTPIAAPEGACHIPVLGNGDIWEAADALGMITETGADGVVIGRGCLGRPWLFRDLADAFAGRAARTLPKLGEVDHGPAARRAAGRTDRRAARLRRSAQAHGLVLQGFPGRRGSAPRAGHGVFVR